MKWLCDRCGHPHDNNTPPCNECGHNTFIKEVERKEPEDDQPATTTQWVCPECGREHPKHSPPCSRCAHPSLKRETIQLDDSDLSAPSYRELVGLRHLVAAVIAVALVGVLGLAAAGAISIPGFAGGSGGSGDVPTVQNVPGNATTFEGVALADVEASYVAVVNDNRTEDGLPELQRTDRLDELATFANQRRVKQQEGDGPVPSRGLRSLGDDSCRFRTVIWFRTVSGSLIGANNETASEAGRRIARSRFEQAGPLLTGVEHLGVDVHVGPSGFYYVTQIAC
jgi:hypothetical protein